MSEANKSICVDRILVSLDTSKHSYAALKAAIELAHHYNAALKGVFVEDTTLLSLAEMGLQQEVGEYSAIVRKISTNSMSRAIFVQSRLVIRTFQKLINQTDLRGNFAILRGKVSNTLDRESEECDLLILGKTGTNPFHSHRLGSTTKAMIRNQKRPILVVEEDNRLGYPMIVLYDNSPAGQIALETARDLLETGEMLIVLLNEEQTDTFDENKRSISEWAANKQINLTIQPYKPHSFTRVLQQIQGLKTGLFILHHSAEKNKRQFVEIVLENVSVPILIINHAS